MATAVVPNLERLAERRAYVDASRFAAVVGDFYAGTPVADAAAAVPALATDLPDLAMQGDTLTVDARVLEKCATAPAGGSAWRSCTSATTTRASPRPSTCRCGAPEPRRRAPSASAAAPTGASSPACPSAGSTARAPTSSTSTPRPSSCSSSGSSSGTATSPTSPGSPTRDPSAPTRTPFFDDLVDPLRRVTANRPDGLEVSPLPEGPTAWCSRRPSSWVPLLSAAVADPVALDLGSGERPAAPLGRYDALPLVGGVGVLTDLTASSVASGPTVPSAEVRIVAAADTLDEVLDRLAAATGSSPRSLDDVREEIGTAAGPTRPAPTP